MTSIDIPASVTSIGNGAFDNGSSLTSITFAGTVEEGDAIEKSDDWAECIPVTEVVCSNGMISL